MFTRSETELTSAATDALLGAFCLAGAVCLAATPGPATWKRALWVWVFGLMSCGSWLGAVVHGLLLSDAARTTIWRPLYLSLGLAVSLVVVGAVCDWRGEATARWLMPWALGIGMLFFAVTQWLGGAFILFIVYEGVATCVALVIYAALLTTGGTPGAGAMVAGIGLSLIAAAFQASDLSLRVFVRFDHNGLFHLVQIAGVTTLVAGLRTRLQSL